MIKKTLFLVGLLSSLVLTGCNKTVKYEPGEALTITSIEMCDEYGDATLFQLNGYDILVDSGSEADASHVKSVLTSKVTDKTIDLLVVTHPHGDHIGGIINDALSNFKVNKIVDYGYTFDTDGNDKINNSSYVQRYVNKRTSMVIAGATYNGVKEEMKANKVLEIDKKNNFNLRWLQNDYYFGQDETFPNAKCSSDNPNTTSVSFCLEYKYWNIIMCGDADSGLAESSITKNHSKLFEDKNKKVLLKGTHHCSSSSMGFNFLDWCKPNTIFTSSAMIDDVCAPNEVKLGSGDGELNHPNKSTVRRIKQSCENFYWNGINGDLTITTDGVNDLSISGAGRNKDYYQKGTTEIVDRALEKDINFFNSKFYEYYK